jgi:hypothetical protein
MGTDSIGLFSGPFDIPSGIILHDSIVYFDDPIFLRFNALNVNTGVVKWGVKGSLPDQPEQIVYFSNHIIAPCQRGRVYVYDANFKLIDTIKIGQPYSRTQIDSITENSLIITATFDQPNDTETGQNFYIDILHLDLSLRSSTSRKYLGRTSHLDESIPKAVSDAYAREIRNRFFKVAGKLYTVDTVDNNIWLKCGNNSFQIPIKLHLKNAYRTVDLDDNRVAFWTFDDNQYVFSVIVLEYAKIAIQ